MGTVAGHGHIMIKQTPMYHEQRAHCPSDIEYLRTGSWKRVNRFSRDPHVKDEVTAVRSAAGMMDVSTLGKFRIHGPDALKALQRVYISDMNQTVPGKLKYSAMLNTSGMLVDDGVVTKVRESDYYFTTSSAWAGEAETWIRYHTRYDNLNFHVVNLTDALAAINIAGPRSREILQLLTDVDLSDSTLPYMGYSEIPLKTPEKSQDQLKPFTTTRVLRVGFLGEMGYELHFPACWGSAVWNLLLEVGTAAGLKPIGLEAQNICRMEKGHVIIGQETEQSTNLLDLGLGFLWSRKDTENQKVGAPALQFTEKQKGRMKLVGLEIQGVDECPDDGAIIYEDNTIMGHVCTARKSISLNKWVAMALVRDPLHANGTSVNIYQSEGKGEKRFTATVVPMPFYDPKGEKLNSRGGK